MIETIKMLKGKQPSTIRREEEQGDKRARKEKVKKKEIGKAKTIEGTSVTETRQELRRREQRMDEKITEKQKETIDKMEKEKGRMKIGRNRER